MWVPQALVPQTERIGRSTSTKKRAPRGFKIRVVRTIINPAFQVAASICGWAGVT